MSTSGKFVRETVEPGVVIETEVPAPDVAPLDLDALQRVGWALAGAVLYLLFTVLIVIALTLSFALWVGCAVGLVAGGMPAGYSLVKAHQLQAARERREHEDKFRVEHAGLVPGMLTAAPVRAGRTAAEVRAID